MSPARRTGGRCASEGGGGRGGAVLGVVGALLGVVGTEVGVIGRFKIDFLGIVCSEGNGGSDGKGLSTFPLFLRILGGYVADFGVVAFFGCDSSGLFIGCD